MGSATLVCEDLEKRYRGGFHLGPLSLEISSGVTCLVGANGAGKSTFFRLAAGTDRPTAGAVRVVGGERRIAPGYLPQEPVLPANASCSDFLTYVAWLQGVPASARATAVAAALSKVGLASRADSAIKNLSGGMRRRLGIGHAIIHDPALLLLDEPTVGLDPRQRVELRKTITSLSGEQVIVVATHLVEDIRGLAKRIILLSEGMIAYDGDIAGLERLATPEAPGDSDLERAIANLMGATT